MPTLTRCPAFSIKCVHGRVVALSCCWDMTSHLWLTFASPSSISMRYYQRIVIDEEFSNLKMEFYIWNRLTKYHYGLIVWIQCHCYSFLKSNIIIVPDTSGTLRSDDWTLMVKCVPFSKFEKQENNNFLPFATWKNNKNMMKKIKCWLLKCRKKSARKGSLNRSEHISISIKCIVEHRMNFILLPCNKQIIALFNSFTNSLHYVYLSKL